MYKGWSFRVIKDTDVNGTYYAISRVYSDDNESDSNIVEVACPIADDFNGLVNQLEEMLEACNKPAIEYKSREEI
jgi:hypothetical protein